MTQIWSSSPTRIKRKYSACDFWDQLHKHQLEESAGWVELPSSVTRTYAAMFWERILKLHKGVEGEGSVVNSAYNTMERQRSWDSRSLYNCQVGVAALQPIP